MNNNFADPYGADKTLSWKTYSRFMEIVTLLTKYALIVVISLMSILVFSQVITRYVLENTPPFMPELATYCLIWTAALGSSLAFRQGKHVAVEILVDKLSPRIARIVKMINIIFLVGFLTTFLVASTYFSISMWEQTSATMKFSMTWPTLGLPVGTVLMILQIIDVFLNKGE